MPPDPLLNWPVRSGPVETAPCLHSRGAIALGPCGPRCRRRSAAGCSDDPSPEPAADAAASADALAAATLLQSGLDQLAAGRAKAARTTFENALTLDPDNVHALYNLGLIAQNADRPRAAVDYYDHALRVRADFVPAIFNKAIALETTDLEQSVDLYRRVVALDDRMAAAHMRLGFALLHLGDTAEGEDHLERGIALDPAMRMVDVPRYE